MEKQIERQWMIETIYGSIEGPFRLVSCNRKGEIGISDGVEIGEICYVPLDTSLIRSGAVILPSNLGGKYERFQLLQQIIDVLKEYFDFTGNPDMLPTAASYILGTWYFDQQDTLKHFYLTGPYGSGKTFLQRMILEMCYHGINCFGLNLDSPESFSILLKLADRYHGTMLINDKMLRHPEMPKFLSCSSARGLPYLLTEKDVTAAFKVFGPKLIASREELPELAQIPMVHYRLDQIKNPSGRRVLDREFYRRANNIRNNLLTWRLTTIEPTEPDLGLIFARKVGNGQN